MTPGRLAPRVLAVAGLLLTGACGDGTPGFCEPLGQLAGLDELSSAIESGDGPSARAEAERLVDLAEEAPGEIRADLRALATAVVDIVDLLERDTSVGDGDEGARPTEVERQRAELNTRLGELDRRATRVSTWAATECGIEL